MENMNWENEMFECYEKAIETCKEMIDEKNEIIKQQQKELDFYHKYEKTDEEIDAEIEELAYYRAEDFLWSLPKPLQWAVTPFFNKFFKVEK